jgi:hypothetical protein
VDHHRTVGQLLGGDLAAVVGRTAEVDAHDHAAAVDRLGDRPLVEFVDPDAFFFAMLASQVG